MRQNIATVYAYDSITNGPEIRLIFKLVGQYRQQVIWITPTNKNKRREFSVTHTVPILIINTLTNYCAQYNTTQDKY